MPGRRGRKRELVRVLEAVRGAQTIEEFAARLGVGASTYRTWIGVDAKDPVTPQPSTLRLVWSKVGDELRGVGVESEEAFLRLGKRNRGAGPA